MKKLSRLTALLLAVVMVLSAAAMAEEGIAQREFDLQQYNQMHSDVQQFGLADPYYEHYVQGLKKLDMASRYEKLAEWYNSWLGSLFYARFVNYYKTAYPNGNLICTCASPLPYGGEGHADGCPWKPVAGTMLTDEETGVTVVGEIPAGVQLNVETASVNDILALEGLPEIEKEAIAGITNKHKVLDISMLMDETAEWQPYSENSSAVNVTMNVSDILNDSDDDVLVYHYHENEDGTVEKQVMGPFKADENGNIRFEMEKFSYVMVFDGTKTVEVDAFYPGKLVDENGIPVAINGNLSFVGVYYLNSEAHFMLAYASNVNNALGHIQSVRLDKTTLTMAEDQSKFTDDQDNFSTIEIKDDKGNVVHTINATNDLGFNKNATGGFVDVNFGGMQIADGYGFAGNEGGPVGWGIAGNIALDLDYEIKKTVLAGTSANVSSDAWKETVTVDRGDWVVFRIEINNLGDRELTNMVIKDILPDDVFDLSSVQKSIDVYDEASDKWIAGDWSAFNLETENLLDDVGESGTTYNGAPKFSRSMYLLARVKNDLSFAGGQVTREFTNTATIDGMNMPTYSDTATVIVNGPTKGKLTIKKAVTAENPNEEIDSQKEFTFTVTGVNNYFKTFTLKNNQKIELDVPIGSYTVTETPENGYSTSITGPDGITVSGLSYTGTMQGDGAPVVAFENKKGMETGSLSISKTVVGIDAPAADAFTFTVEFTGKGLPAAGFGYTKSADDIDEITWTHTTVDEVDTLTGTLVLKANENVVFNNLPTNIGYKVTETPKAGYTADVAEMSGTISASESVAAFTNSYNFGSLEISKTVTGAPENWSDTFTFTIALSDTTLTGTYSDVEFTNGVATVQLQGGQSKKISGLPNGATYTVTETANSAYKTTVGGIEGNAATGTISNTATATAAFNNELRVGALTISKTVTDYDTTDTVVPEANQEFTFTVTLPVGEYSYTKTGVDALQTLKVEAATGTGTIVLKDSESVTIQNLLADTDYAVSETVPTGFTVNQSSFSGKIRAGETAAAAFINTFKVADLTITKRIVDANGASVTDTNVNDDVFTFSVTIGGATTEHKITGASSVTIHDIPIGTSYTVTETNLPTGYSIDDAAKTVTDSIAEDGNTATFTNTYTTGSLAISKTVVGKDAPSGDTFTFTVTLPDGTFNYTIGETTGTISGGGTITLAGGQTATITGIPAGAAYTVTEELDDDYTTTMTGATGTIDANAPQTAAFINTYKTGNLQITKSGLDNGDHAIFNVTVTKGGYNKTFRIVMTNETVTLADLPYNATYEVTEESGWAWRYGTTTITYGDQSKTIDYNDTVTVVNEKTEDKWLDDESSIENKFNGVNPSGTPNS